MGQKPTDPPCQTEACALQSCLGKNTYRPEKCDDYVRKLYKCCWEMYERTDGKGESTACPLPNITRLWLKQHGEGVE